MKKHYDFSKGERGRFYRKDAVIELPIYLDKKNREFVETIARRKKVDVSTVVNELIESDRKFLKVVSES